MFDLNGKVALVTGASSGIGRRQAQVLAQAGACVVLLGRRQQQLDAVVEAIEALIAVSSSVFMIPRRNF